MKIETIFDVEGRMKEYEKSYLEIEKENCFWLNICFHWVKELSETPLNAVTKEQRESTQKWFQMCIDLIQRCKDRYLEEINEL